MMHLDRKRNGGFTLIELMIVVAIIGVLASVAIPSFVNYQLTSKRSEAYANLASLAKSQKAYFAEFNDFVAVAAEPSFSVLPRGKGQLKRAECITLMEEPKMLCDVSRCR